MLVLGDTARKWLRFDPADVRRLKLAARRQTSGQDALRSAARCGAPAPGPAQGSLPERVVTDPDLDDAADNQARLQLLTQHREYGTRTGLFDGFLDDVRWQWMAISPAEPARVRYIDTTTGSSCRAAPG